MTDDHLVNLGHAILKLRWLTQLRNELGISRRQLASIIGVSTQTLKRWEDGAELESIWGASARRVGDFYSKAVQELEKLHNMGDGFKEYLPVSVVASYLGTPSPVVEKMCEAGELDCLNLGILGIYVKHRKQAARDASR